MEEREPFTLNTPLHCAAGFGHERIIKLLLSHKADVNSRCKTGTTPLHCASQEGHLASVVALLQAGADPLLSGDECALPIHRAARNNHTEVVRTLIEKTECKVDQVRHTEMYRSSFECFPLGIDSLLKIAIYCPQGSGTLRQQLTILHYLALYCMVLHDIAWYCMVWHGFV